MEQPDLAAGVIWYVVFVYSTVCHEAAHAWAAYRMGDRTAYEGGQVSLDPTPHIRREPIGMILMPIVSFFYNGWALGWASAPYDPEWGRRYPRREAWMAIAGPAANLLLLIGTSLLIVIGSRFGVFHAGDYRYEHVAISNAGPVWDGCARVLSIIWTLNLLLFLFNLLPLPPMDGSAIPLFFLRGQTAAAYQQMMQQPGLRIFGWLVAVRGFGYVFIPIYIHLRVWLEHLQ